SIAPHSTRSPNNRWAVGLGSPERAAISARVSSGSSEVNVSNIDRPLASTERGRGWADCPVSPFTVRDSTRLTPTGKTPFREWRGSHPRHLHGEHGGTAGTHDVQRFLEALLELP